MNPLIPNYDEHLNIVHELRHYPVLFPPHLKKNKTNKMNKTSTGLLYLAQQSHMNFLALRKKEKHLKKVNRSFIINTFLFCI